MCGYIGKISKSAFDYDQVSIANKHTVCRGPDQKREGCQKDIETAQEVLEHRQGA